MDLKRIALRVAQGELGVPEVDVKELAKQILPKFEKALEEQRDGFGYAKGYVDVYSERATEINPPFEEVRLDSAAEQECEFVFDYFNFDEGAGIKDLIDSVMPAGQVADETLTNEILEEVVRLGKFSIAFDFYAYGDEGEDHMVGGDIDAMILKNGEMHVRTTNNVLDP